MGDSENKNLSCAGCGAPLDAARAEILTCQFCGRKNRNPNPPSPPPVRPKEKEFVEIVDAKPEPVKYQTAPTTHQPRHRRNPSWPYWFVFGFMGIFFVGPILLFCVCCPLLGSFSSNPSTTRDPANRNFAKKALTDPKFDRAVEQIKKECESRNQVMADVAAIKYISENRIEDLWGTAVAYKKIDAKRFKLSSFGFDKTLGTDDDLERVVSVELR